MKNVVIVSAARTPVGSFGGAFKGVSAVDLGVTAAKEAIKRAGIKAEDIDEAIIGNVLQAGLGQNVARQVILHAGLPQTTPAMTINKVCGSGLRAVSLAAQIIKAGDADIVLAGGTESMSSAPFILKDARWGARMGDKKLVDEMIKDGTVTAANASGINDGAAMVIVMSEDKAKELGVEPMAKIASYASAGVDPKIMGTGPIPSSRKALEKAGWEFSELDLIEANEAFAAQAGAVAKTLGLDMDKTNVNGGAIAIGHPIGASGTRILTTLLYEMKRRDAKKGLATLCIGGGMGTALTVER